jgi:sec-independent protein translocase protein TatA
MFGISFEHILIVGVVLLIFGPRRLPELGMTMGKAVKNFKDSISGIEEANFKRVNEPEKSEKTANAPETNTQA